MNEENNDGTEIAGSVTSPECSLNHMVRPTDDDDVWHRLEAFTVMMRKVNDDMKAAMKGGEKQDVRESILLAASGCRLIQEACSQLAASGSDQIGGCRPAQDSEIFN